MLLVNLHGFLLKLILLTFDYQDLRDGKILLLLVIVFCYDRMSWKTDDFVISVVPSRENIHLLSPFFRVVSFFLSPHLL